MKAVILAGGSGTRLWPLSRQKEPKQFHSLLGKKSMVAETIRRLKFLSPSDIYIASNKEYSSFIQKLNNSVPKENIIIEPALRDTASCIGLAAAIIEKRSSPDEVMAVIYADHYIKDFQEFEKKIKYAARIAEKEETINIIEVKAKYPNPNLGYVKIGRLLSDTEEGSVYKLERFVEKPNLKAAKKMVESFNYLWNTGLYVWKVKTILEQFKEHLTNTYERLKKIQDAYDTPQQQKVLKEQYQKCKKISIDYAIMEKINPALVRIIIADLGWNDIGTWEALHKELATNPRQNIIKGNHLLLETEGSVIYNFDKRLIAVIGLKDMTVINTEDVVLVCPKNRSQDVKKVVELLKRKRKKNLI